MVQVNLSVYLIKHYMGEWRYSSTIPDLDIRWRWIVSFTPRPLYPQRKNPGYPLDMRLGGPHGQFGCCGNEEKFAPVGNRVRAVHPVARPYTDWAIPDSVLYYAVQSCIFYDIMCIMEVFWRFGEHKCFYIQGQSVSKVINQQERSRKSVNSYQCTRRHIPEDGRSSQYRGENIRLTTHYSSLHRKCRN
jgi:hypothetical protein